MFKMEKNAAEVFLPMHDSLHVFSVVFRWTHA